MREKAKGCRLQAEGKKKNQKAKVGKRQIALSLRSLYGRWFVRCAHSMADGKTDEREKWGKGETGRQTETRDRES
jgi:hypothetical protein